MASPFTQLPLFLSESGLSVRYASPEFADYNKGEINQAE